MVNEKFADTPLADECFDPSACLEPWDNAVAEIRKVLVSGNKSLSSSWLRLLVDPTRKAIAQHQERQETL